MILHEWDLPLGDTYIVRSHTKHRYISEIRRESYTTLCCHGTDRMAVIRQYFEDVQFAQTDLINGIGTSADIHLYWTQYKARMIRTQSERASHNKTKRSSYIPNDSTKSKLDLEDKSS